MLRIPCDRHLIYLVRGAKTRKSNQGNDGRRKEQIRTWTHGPVGYERVVDNDGLRPRSLSVSSDSVATGCRRKSSIERRKLYTTPCIFGKAVLRTALTNCSLGDGWFPFVENEKGDPVDGRPHFPSMGAFSEVMSLPGRISRKEDGLVREFRETCRVCAFPERWLIHGIRVLNHERSTHPNRKHSVDRWCPCRLESVFHTPRQEDPDRVCLCRHGKCTLVHQHRTQYASCLLEAGKGPSSRLGKYSSAEY